MYRAIDKWLLPYLFRSRLRGQGESRHILLCVCDHFEPFHDATREEALARVELWRQRLPVVAGQCRDADGVLPAHTFFYPIEQYDASIMEALREVCEQNHTEVEVHLHHDNDTAENLMKVLAEGKQRLVQHGFLSRDMAGEVRYGFIHGNWALGDSHPSGRFCGVRNELTILRRTGCYADFTMPSAPDATQARTINSVYYATDAGSPRPHDTGRRMKVGTPPDRGDQSEDLLLVQGPLGLNWERRKFGVLPRVENGEISGANPPRPDRLRVWCRLGVQVAGRPDWIVIKLHTHGALPRNTKTLLGDAMADFYRYLTATDQRDDLGSVHFVTARELVNILHAAEAGKAGSPGEYRDFVYRRQ